MKIIKIIRDKDLRLDTSDPKIWAERTASRAVIFDSAGKVALLHVSKNHYHKLPGGGVEEGENLLEALKRESLEEVGCLIKDIQELAISEEYFGQNAEHQTDHCFIAKVDGEIGNPNFTDKEKSFGFKVVWTDLDSAITILESEAPSVKDYEGKFITLRDLTFLKKAKKIICEGQILMN